MSNQQFPDRTPILFEVSRWVTGDMHELKDKTDNNKRPRVYDATHKKAGQVMQECYFGIAIAKAPGQTHWALKPTNWDQTHPNVPYWGEVIWMAGNAAWPALCNNPQKYITLPTFAWKIEDGDDTTPKGEKQTRNCDKPGHPGCWIVHLKTWKVPDLYTQYGDSVITDRSTVKRGAYVRVAGDVQGNGQNGKPGVYINHDKVAYVPTENEEEIRGNGGVDARTAFGGGVALPSGVVAKPNAFTGAPSLPGSAGALPPAGLPATGVALPGAPAGLPAGVVVLPGASAAGLPAGFPNVSAAQPSPSNGALPQTAVQPKPGFLQVPGLALPVVAQQPVAPVLAPAVAAQGHTWASLQAAGVTLETAKANGWVL